MSHCVVRELQEQTEAVESLARELSQICDNAADLAERAEEGVTAGEEHEQQTDEDNSACQLILRQIEKWRTQRRHVQAYVGDCHVGYAGLEKLILAIEDSCESTMQDISRLTPVENPF